MSSGKTSTIIALAKTMYKQRYKSMTLEMNASDARGIDVPVRHNSGGFPVLSGWDT